LDSLTERDLSKHLVVDERKNIKIDLREIGWTALIWLRIETGNMLM
jgi:hypothetical protein